MRKLILTLLAATATLMAVSAQEHQLTFMLTGASFAVSENGWFEAGCADMDAVAINKSVSGSAVYGCARDMFNGKLYTTAELDATDVLVIDHVHNQNVADPTYLKDDYTEYEANIMTSTNYAQGYDYVIKRYIADCRALKDNPDSRYYGTEEGKPVKIMFCTHWHDGRTTYNPAIRKLAEKWGFPLIEFDTQIGFTKDVPAGTAQPSLAYAHDTETINGVKYGWHPLRGQNSYIQRLMAQIFVDKAVEYLGLDVPFESELKSVNPIVMKGETARVALMSRSGRYPFTVAFTTGENAPTTTDDAVNSMPYFIELNNVQAATAVTVASVKDSQDRDAVVSGKAEVLVADKSIAPNFDGYIHEAYKENTYTTNETLQLKNGDNWGRHIFLTFPTDEIDPDAARISVGVYFESYVLGTRSDDKRGIDGIETLQVLGNAHTYTSTLKWNNANYYTFDPISTTTIVPTQKDSYIDFDVTDWVKQQIAEGAPKLTFRIKVIKTTGMLSNFTATESTTGTHFPRLLVAKESITSLSPVISYDAVSLNGGKVENPSGVGFMVYDAVGRVVYAGADSEYSLSSLAKGIYLLSTTAGTTKFAVR